MQNISVSNIEYESLMNGEIIEVSNPNNYEMYVHCINSYTNDTLKNCFVESSNNNKSKIQKTNLSFIEKFELTQKTKSILKQFDLYNI